MVRLLALVAVAGCSYRVTFHDCLVTCATASDCPADFTCGNEGLCRAGGVTASCADVLGDAGVTEDSKAIVSFRFELAKNPSLRSDTPGKITGVAIAADARFATSISGLVATFVTTGARVTASGIDQVSGMTANDFSAPVTYTVTARDGTTRDYTVTVVRAELADAVDFTMSSYAQTVAFGDVDGDGRPDLATASGTSAYLRMNTTPSNASTPSFGSPFDLSAASPYDAELSDINGDGKPDLLVANDSGTVSISINTTPGGATTPSFAPPVSFPAGSSPYTILVADLDGDNKPDVVVRSFVVSSETGSTTILRNKTATGAMAASFDVAAELNVPSYDIALADVDRDGRLDLLVLDYPAAKVRIYLNTSTPGQLPTFVASTSVQVISGSQAIAVADVNGDGKPDLAVSGSGSSMGVSVFVNTTTAAASATFSAGSAFATGQQPQGLLFLDLDGDGRVDLVVCNAVDNTISVFLNETKVGATKPAFRPKLDFKTGDSPFSVIAGDVNTDGRLDLAVADVLVGKISVLLAE